MALHYLVDAAFDDLLCCWRHYDDMKVTEAPVTKLAASRHQLDQARNRMQRLRLVMYPSPEERESVQVVALCSALDQVVHLGARHRHATRPGVLVCICGEQVPIHR